MGESMVLLEIELSLRELKVLSHLVIEKVTELQRLQVDKITSKLGGSYRYFQDLILFSAFIKNRISLAPDWKKNHIIELKEKELEWVINFAREKMGELVRTGATNYGEMKIEEFKSFVEKLERQKKEARIVL
jgi:hypothetical protein